MKIILSYLWIDQSEVIEGGEIGEKTKGWVEVDITEIVKEAQRKLQYL